MLLPDNFIRHRRINFFPPSKNFRFDKERLLFQIALGE